MCNIIGLPCKVCGEMEPIHIADFCTPPTNLEVFCGKHIPASKVAVFTWKETDRFAGKWRKGERMAIRVRRLTPKIKAMVAHYREYYPNTDWYDHICPNTGAKTTVEVLP